MKYVVLKDDETDEIIGLGRFAGHGVAEILHQEKWNQANTLFSDLFDGLLEEITEAEAMKIIAQRQPQLEAA